ncbi:Hypothetical_protein [Hexamita inflata]|uniref:Hypothetical_protein n=1 Tax=Hexamita inflata TaxID=28002 RepID=A0AA86TIS4_9EUKA|nr:Hypothetical protein HINF_LOCUS6136 [Hexamita inflata]
MKLWSKNAICAKQSNQIDKYLLHCVECTYFEPYSSCKYCIIETIQDIFLFGLNNIINPSSFREICHLNCQYEAIIQLDSKLVLISNDDKCHILKLIQILEQYSEKNVQSHENSQDVPNSGTLTQALINFYKYVKIEVSASDFKRILSIQYPDCTITADNHNYTQQVSLSHRDCNIYLNFGSDSVKIKDISYSNNNLLIISDDAQVKINSSPQMLNMLVHSISKTLIYSQSKSSFLLSPTKCSPLRYSHSEAFTCLNSSLSLKSSLSSVLQTVQNSDPEQFEDLIVNYTNEELLNILDEFCKKRFQENKCTFHFEQHVKGYKMIIIQQKMCTQKKTEYIFDDFTWNCRIGLVLIGNQTRRVVGENKDAYLGLLAMKQYLKQ